MNLGDYARTISSYSGYAYIACCIDDSGSLNGTGVNNYGLYPVVVLKPTIQLSDSGTQSQLFTS